jgi:uncharacterized protein (TIGR03435 family)
MRDKFGIWKKLFIVADSFAALVVTIALVMIFAPPSRAQSAAAKPQFEVASVKPNTDDGRMIYIRIRSGDRVLMHNNQVGSMILYAYNVSDYQIIGNTRLPEHWNWYDVDAKLEGSPSDEEIRLMFQSLLEDRFKLKVHHETREMEVYKLVVAKGGPKLNHATEGDYKTTIEDRSVTVRKGTVSISMWKEGAHLIGKSVTTAQLASALIGALGGPVVDTTGIEGTFDFDVLFAPANWPPDAEFNPPALLAALKDTLGLALEKGNAQVDVLVIDHLEKPTPN